MQPEKWLSAIARFVGVVALLDLAAVLLTALLVWAGGAFTPFAFGNGLVWAGMIVAGLGVASLFGAGRFAGDWRYLQSQSVMPASLHERTRQNVLDVVGSLAFVFQAGTAGLLCVVLGLALMSRPW